jgi:hypothetical protein
VNEISSPAPDAPIPELGQMVFGQPLESCAMPLYARSLFVGIQQEWERVWWNIHQQQFHDHDSGDMGALHWRPYVYQSDEDAGPNFWLDGHPMRVRWYKHPGRSMSCSQNLSPAEWVAWHDAVMAELERLEEVHDARG